MVKITESDAKRIQADTGESPEDLEDSDLQEAMQELGIKSQPLTDEDRKALGMPPAAAPSAAPAPAASAPAASPAPVAPGPAAGAPAATSIEAQLQQLAKLRDQGLITPADYEAKKKQLLGL